MLLVDKFGHPHARGNRERSLLECHSMRYSHRDIVNPKASFFIFSTHFYFWFLNLVEYKLIYDFQSSIIVKLIQVENFYLVGLEKLTLKSIIMLLLQWLNIFSCSE